jgi:hypothetical protein
MYAEKIDAILVDVIENVVKGEIKNLKERLTHLDTSDV